MTSPMPKPVPLAVRVNAAGPGLALVGSDDVSVRAGCPGSTVKVTPATEVPPPGAGFVAVMVTWFGVRMSDARTCTESWPVFWLKEVDRGEPFQLMKVTPIELDIKPVPVTAMVNPSLPAVMTEGNRSVTVGVGLKGTELPPHPAKTKLAATDSSATQRERFKPASS